MAHDDLHCEELIEDAQGGSDEGGLRLAYTLTLGELARPKRNHGGGGRGAGGKRGRLSATERMDLVVFGKKEDASGGRAKLRQLTGLSK